MSFVLHQLEIPGRGLSTKSTRFHGNEDHTHLFHDEVLVHTWVHAPPEDLLHLTVNIAAEDPGVVGNRGCSSLGFHGSGTVKVLDQEEKEQLVCHRVLPLPTIRYLFPAFLGNLK